MKIGNYFANSLDQITQLEDSLGTVLQDDLRIGICNQLISGYIFTDLDKAGKLIDDLGRQMKDLSKEEEWRYLYNRAWFENQNYHYSVSSDLFSNLLAHIHYIHEDYLKVELYLDYAGTAINTNSIELAKELLEKSKTFIDQLDLVRHNARYYTRRGYVSLQNNNYIKALEHFYTAEKLFLTEKKSCVLKDYYFLILLHSGFGHIFEKNNEVERSIKAYTKVLSIAKKRGLKSRMSWFYLNVGKGYMAMDSIDDAIKYFKKGLSHSFKSFDQSKGNLLANLGFCYYSLQSYDKAIKFYDAAETAFIDIGKLKSLEMAILCRWKGMLYCKVKSFEKAEENLAKAFEIANALNDFKQLANICKEVAHFYSDIDDFENAYEYMLLNNELTETFLEEINDRKIKELEVKYQVQKQIETAEFLKLQTINLQLKALRAQMNPHFMYNALNAIQSFITSNRQKEAVGYLAKFAKLMRQSLEYSNVEQISIEKEVKFLKDYLEINQKLRFEDNLSYNVYVDDELDEEIGVPTMIVQPYVENAIEHGLRLVKNGVINLSFEYLDEDNILCIIEDNGIGRKKTKELQENDLSHREHKSRGTSITEKRLQLLHKKYDKNQVFVNTIDLEDEDTGEALGTRVQIVLPATEIVYNNEEY